jgi:hypothetical protein
MPGVWLGMIIGEVVAAILSVYWAFAVLRQLTRGQLRIAAS